MCELRLGLGDQIVPGVTGTDYKEPVLASRALVLTVAKGCNLSITFFNDGARETSVMIFRQADPVLGTWTLEARKGNGGGKDYSPVLIQTSVETVFLISGWNKPPSEDISTAPWYQSYCRRNEHDDLKLEKGMLFSPAFDDGSGDEFKEPRLLIKCLY